jgi:hypothetical protein
VRRILSIAVIGVWLVMTGLLVRRTWPPSVPPVSTADATAPTVGDEWMGVYHQHDKVGYTHHTMVRSGDSFSFIEESLLRLTVMDTPQTVRTSMRGHIGTDYALRDIDFELSSGLGTLRATGVIAGSEMRLTLNTGKDSSEQRLPLTEPIYLPSDVRTMLTAGPLRGGQQLERLVFDPMTLKREHIHVTVQQEEAVPEQPPTVRGWRLREEFQGLETTAWIDAAGAVLREEGPMGLVLVRQTAEQALNQGWSSVTALDLMTAVAVPVAEPIDDPRNRRSLRLALSGIDLNSVPSDDEQVRNGAELTITRPDLGTLASYQLPYTDSEFAGDLAATPFLQSDHPRVQVAAREALGDEHDARRAAQRLSDWVYAHLRKVPTISMPNALQVLDMGEGDCNEHAVLFAALGRAVGLPTRVVAGAVYLDGAFLYHAWCEVWLGRWVSVDPTWHQFPADATHVKFVVGGPEQHVAMLNVIGRLGVHVLDGSATQRH